MNKLTKGSIAGAAGVVLLVGGAGTFALWNDSETVEVGTIASGTLTIAGTGVGEWKNIAPDAVASIANISTYRIVPGDIVEYTKTFDVEAVGDNLDARVTSNIADIAAESGIDGATTGASFVVSPAEGTSGTSEVVDGAYTFGAGEYSVEATVTVTFPAEVDGTTGQNQTVDFSDLAVALTQTR